MRRAALSSVLGLALAAMIAGGLEAQQQDSEDRLARAVAALDATEVEAAKRILRELGAELTSRTPADLATEVYIRLGVIYVSETLLDSAAAEFAAAVRRNPFVRMDPERYNPDVIQAFEEARRATPALGLRAPYDTTVQPDTGSWPVTVAVGLPGVVELRFVPADDASSESFARTIAVDSVQTVRTSFTSPGAAWLPMREYRVVAWLRDVAADTASMRVRVERLPADTVAHPPPLDSGRFLPERRRAAPSVSSLVKGVLFGAAAVAIPLSLANPDVQPRSVQGGAVAVGAAIAVGGVVGLTIKRYELNPQNVLHNVRLRTEWERENRAVAEENARRRHRSPLHITLKEEP
ncbi:MAG TPA: hypothetical protein VGA37_14790 [Gemmatimonadales bacterium]